MNPQKIKALAEIRDTIENLEEQSSDVDIELAKKHDEALRDIWNVLLKFQIDIDAYKEKGGEV